MEGFDNMDLQTLRDACKANDLPTSGTKLDCFHRLLSGAGDGRKKKGKSVDAPKPTTDDSTSTSPPSPGFIAKEYAALKEAGIDEEEEITNIINMRWKKMQALKMDSAAPDEGDVDVEEEEAEQPSFIKIPLKLTSEQAELRAELEFYRGLMRADGDSEGLRLHRVEWSALDSERVLLRAVLVRAGPQNRVVEGTLAMRLRGRRGDKVVETPISELLAGPPPAERFRLRHFQEWEAELRLPRGFTPERLIATIDPRGAVPIVKSMPWADLEAER